MTNPQQLPNLGINLPTLSTVRNLPSFFPSADLTIPAVHSHIFKSQDRFDSKGRRIPGNGLADTGAIIRRGRKVLIDVDRYGAWLAGKPRSAGE